MTGVFLGGVAGRFRSGRLIDGKPSFVHEWRFTTDQADIAARICGLLGGSPPHTWDGPTGDNLEVFTASKEVAIILEGPKDLRQRMQLWSRSNKLVIDSDGETLADGQPDPDAELSFAERKKKYDDGVGPGPSITVYFRLADEPDLGIFMFQTGSWIMPRELAGDQVDAALQAIGGPSLCVLQLEHIVYVRRTGPLMGELVDYMKPRLSVIGPALVRLSGSSLD